MFEYIYGKLAEKNPAFAVIEAGGIGYLLHISLTTYSQIGEQEFCRLYTHQVIRDDAHLLFGFSTQDERNLFRLLISVSGIGPNTARLLLSSMSLQELRNAIQQGHVGILKSIKGIGEKTALRIIVDLKDKVEKSDIIAEKLDVSHNTIRQEALSGLTVLGFHRKNVEKALDQIIKAYLDQQAPEGGGKPLSVEVLIKEALKIL